VGGAGEWWAFQCREDYAMAGCAQYLYLVVAILSGIAGVLSLPADEPAVSGGLIALALLCFVGFMVARIWELVARIWGQMSGQPAQPQQAQQPAQKKSPPPQPKPRKPKPSPPGAAPQSTDPDDLLR